MCQKIHLFGNVSMYSTTEAYNRMINIEQHNWSYETTITFPTCVSDKTRSKKHDTYVAEQSTNIVHCMLDCSWNQMA